MSAAFGKCTGDVQAGLVARSIDIEGLLRLETGTDDNGADIEGAQGVKHGIVAKEKKTGKEDTNQGHSNQAHRKRSR